MQHLKSVKISTLSYSKIIYNISNSNIAIVQLDPNSLLTEQEQQTLAQNPNSLLIEQEQQTLASKNFWVFREPEI